MTINERKQGGITILQAQGRLDSTSAPDMDRCMSKLIDGGAMQVFIDLSGLEYVSSAGLRVLLSAAKRIKQAQGKLALASPSPQVRQVFNMAGFSSILPIFETIDDALGSCTSTAPRTEPVNMDHCMLSAAEEIFLLSLDESRGLIKPIPTFALDYALGAALLMELSLCDRIDTDLTTLKVISTEPTGNPLLDDTLQKLQEKSEPQLTSFWLKLVTEREGQLAERVLAQLIRKGMLKQENRRILWVFEVHRYSLMNNRDVKEVRTRLRELILSDDIPDPRDVVLISLGKACLLLNDLFTPKEYESRAHARIDALARLDLIGHEMANAILDIENAMAAISTPIMQYPPVFRLT
jgi:anti-anti-sigma factor